MSKKSVSRIYMDKEHIPSSFDINTFKGLNDMVRVCAQREERDILVSMSFTHVFKQHTHTLTQHATPRNDDSYRK